MAVARVEVEVRGRTERVKSLEFAMRERAGEQSPTVVLDTVQQTLQKIRMMWKPRKRPIVTRKKHCAPWKKM